MYINSINTNSQLGIDTINIYDDRIAPFNTGIDRPRPGRERSASLKSQAHLFPCGPRLAPLRRSSLAGFQHNSPFACVNVWRRLHPRRTGTSPAITAKRREKQKCPGRLTRDAAPLHFPAGGKLWGVCGGTVWLGAADGLVLNTGPLPATLLGLKTSRSQRLRGAVAQLYEEQVSCRMLRPRLNYTGDSGSLSLSSERMNQMIPLLVSPPAVFLSLHQA